MKMAFRGSSIFFLLTLVASLSRASASPTYEDDPPISRSSFPAGFIFGSASSAYQIEGAPSEGGKGPSIWDTYTHKYPEKIADRSNGDVAIDAYHHYKEDVQLMKELGFDAYRFSISWTRILPVGNLRGGVNKEGIRYYNNLINELLSNGVQPFATLFHWDFPQALEDDYGGFLSNKVIGDFRNYADICFKEFGDRVKHWTTFNEPWTYSGGGYASGTLAPGRCSSWFANCTGGDSGTEPYIVTHNQLLSHAAAVKLYREKYQASQKGIIGITNLFHWIMPSSSEKSNGDAAQRAIDFMFGMFMDPLTQGRYPESMISLVGKRLPRFTKEQSLLVNGSFDFIGINYYTAYFATNVPSSNGVNPSFYTDSHAGLSGGKNGITIGAQAASPWLFVYPRGLRDLLIYTKKKYNNPRIYITENGIDELNSENLSLKEALEDDMRIDYYHQHLLFLQQAIREGVNIKGYFAWSTFDNFEWGDGYKYRFGINYVDYKDGLKRYPKNSALWFKKLLKK